VIRQSVKGRKTPHPLTKDTILWHTGSNVIGFIFRNSNQKGGNPLKEEKSHACKLILLNTFTPTELYGMFQIKAWTIPF